MPESQPTAHGKRTTGMLEPRPFGVEDRPPCPLCGAEMPDACRHVALIDVWSYTAETEILYFRSRVVVAAGEIRSLFVLTGKSNRDLRKRASVVGLMRRSNVR
jgi:hypothetical protein